MKKILLFAYLCLALVLVSNEGFRVGPITLLSPEQPTCVHPGMVKTVLLRQMATHFYCGVTHVEQDRITELIGHALDAMPSGVLQPADVFVFTDLNQGVLAEAAWLKTKGYTPPIQSLRATWLDNGLIGQTFKGAVFLYVGNSAWNRDPAVSSLAVLHEMHHLLQYQLVDSSHPIPLWLQEGGADEFALLQLSALGLPVPSRSASAFHCDYSLSALEYERQDVPLACAYAEGAQAVRLLLNENGQQAYYQLLRNIGTNSSFNAAFVRTYGFNLGEFSRRFDAFRKSSYAVHPGFTISYTPVDSQRPR